MKDEYSLFNRSEPLRYVPRKAIPFYYPSEALTDEENSAFKHLIELAATEITLDSEMYDSSGQLHNTTINVRIPERYGKSVSRFLKLVSRKMSSSVNGSGFSLALIEPDPSHTAVVDGILFEDVNIAGFESATPIRVERLGGNHQGGLVEHVTLRLMFGNSKNSVEAKDFLNNAMKSVLIDAAPVESKGPVSEKPKAAKRKPTAVKKPKTTTKK